MSVWENLLKELIGEQLGQRNGDVASICAMYLDRYPEVLESAKTDVFMQALRRKCKSIMDKLSDDDKQLDLFGIDLPSVIAIKSSGTDFYYVRSDLATWAELISGRRIREENISAATAKLKSYDETLDRLRPYMSSSLTMTVADVINLLARTDRDAQ